MKPISSGSNAGDAYLAIRRKARDTQRPTHELLQLYALEGFLDRLAASNVRSTLVLKGGVLLAAFDARRPTRDIDIAATDVRNDVQSVEHLVRQIIECSPARADGLTFDAESITCTTIREDDIYSGVRAKLVGELATATITFHVDVNVGDPIWPRPDTVELPRILGGDPIRLLGYPMGMVIAEKSVTAMQRGSANTRFRDFADIWTLTGRYEFAAEELRAALQVVMDYRKVAVIFLRDSLASYADEKQSQWAAWRHRWERDELPESFGEVVSAGIKLVDPILEGTLESATWSPKSRTWIVTS